MKREALAILIAVSGCAIEESDDDFGETSQDVDWIGPISWGTTNDLDGANTGLPAGSHVCVINAVGGDISSGGGRELGPDPGNGDIHGVVSVIENAEGGNRRLLAHGGRYGWQNWANSPVKGGATCMAGEYSRQGVWKTFSRHAANRKFLTYGAPGRVCFLTGVYAGSDMMNKQTDYAKVAYEASTNEWYIDSSMIGDDWNTGYVFAGCIDFPSVTGYWGGAFGGATNTMTTGNGVKFCGLQGIYGAFGAQSYRDGVFLNPPSTQTGNWTMTVSPGKYGEAACVQ